MENYKDILKMAVENEVEAYEFYKDAASKVTDKNLKSTFEELAEEETKHKVLLEDYLKNDLKNMSFKENKDYQISETVEEKALSTSMNFKDAIALAMKKEEEAMNMYKQFAEASDDDKQRKTFEELVKMEQQHKTRLEDIYVNAAYTEVW
ncbi:ferritin family protein [Proteinivorax tanatarense]|uniref:Ferritin family protein n=1 Tax=Proteinivorax tanatarense TaxID=1260629 RepID=A0AAU7VK11_9FIRM